MAPSGPQSRSSLFFFLWASCWSDCEGSRLWPTLKTKKNQFRRNLVGRKKTAGPAHIALISQDITAFLFPPVERCCCGDIASTAAAKQYMQGIRNTEVSLYAGHIHRGRQEDIQARLAIKTASSLDDLVAHCVPHQFAHRVYFQFAHDVGAVRFRGLHADAERSGHFLAALAFREQLHDLALS